MIEKEDTLERIEKFVKKQFDEFEQKPIRTIIKTAIVILVLVFLYKLIKRL